jgi:hypothetical protein
MFGVIMLSLIYRDIFKGVQGVLEACPELDSKIIRPQPGIPTEAVRKMMKTKWILIMACWFIICDAVFYLPTYFLISMAYRYSIMSRAAEFTPGKGPELHLSELGGFDSGILDEVHKLRCSDNQIYCGKFHPPGKG